MSHQQLDAQGEAHDALGTAVSSYGQRVLSDPHILSNLVTDLLPDLPRERSLLVAGAEAGIAADMTQHVEEQHIDPDTAVQLVARTLSERRAIDPSASMWVASEYAQALGYRVRPFSQPVQGDGPPAVPTMQPQAMQPQGMPGIPPTMTAMGTPLQTQPPAPGQVPQGPPPQSWPPSGQSWPPSGQSWPPPQGPSGPSGPSGPMGPSGPSGPSGPGGYQPQPPSSWPPAPAPGGPGMQPGQSWPPPQGPMRPSPAGGNRKRGLIAGGTAIGVVVLYLIIAAVAGIAPFGKSPTPPPPTSSPSPHPPSPSPRPTPTPSPRLAAGVVPLTQLLPGGIADPSTDCKTLTPPFNWTNPGLVSALQCTDPNLSGGQIYAYQMNSTANYLTAWQNFNKWWGFNISNAGPNCPPSSGSSQGTYGWNAKDFPARSGQVLECGTVGSGSSAAPAYAYAMPTEDTFFVAQGADGSSFTALNNWWSNNSMPIASPAPTS
jgi:hypothetical protein